MIYLIEGWRVERIPGHGWRAERERRVKWFANLTTAREWVKTSGRVKV